MARRPTLNIDQTAHVTFRCNNRKFLLNLEENWFDISSWLNCLPAFFGVDLHHFVAMSNHFHLLLTPRKEPFGKAMCYLLTNLSKMLNFMNNRINHSFGNRYCATIIKSESHMINVIRYIYQNPIRAGLSKSIKEYQFSSFGFYSGLDNPRILIKPDIGTINYLRNGLGGLEMWLKEIVNPLSNEDIELLNKSFSKFEFGFSKRQILSAFLPKISIRF